MQDGEGCWEEDLCGAGQLQRLLGGRGWGSGGVGVLSNSLLIYKQEIMSKKPFHSHYESEISGKRFSLSSPWNLQNADHLSGQLLPLLRYHRGAKGLQPAR